MKNIKISLICTLKNEENSIKEFLDSLLSLSRPPDEIIIVDGGSTDRTVKIINTYIENGAPIKLIVKNGANIAEGRNIAIKNAKHDIIASTDAGCRIDRDWLKNLIKPFEEYPSVDVVSGWYEADAKTEFEKCVAELTYPKLERVMKNSDKFLPSSRSVAYKKKCWEKVGGYLEWLYTAEDTLFDLNLKKARCKFVFAKDAVVYWKVRPNLKSVFKQHYLYARGNGEAKIHVGTHILLCFIYGIGLIMLLYGLVYYHPLLPILFILCSIYSFRPIIFYKIKYIDVSTKLIYIPVFTLIRDIGKILGWIVGIFNSYIKNAFISFLRWCYRAKTIHR